MPRGAWLIGGSVTLANFAFKRPRVPITANVAYNQSLRRQWNKADGAIATQNVTRLGAAPLRIRSTREPQLCWRLARQGHTRSHPEHGR